MLDFITGTVRQIQRTITTKHIDKRGLVITTYIYVNDKLLTKKRNYIMKVGDKVICIKSHVKGVTVKGKIYTVLEIIECEGCGSVCLDVGIKTREDVPGTFCYNCNTQVNIDTIWYQASERFRKIEPLIHLRIK